MAYPRRVVFVHFLLGSRDDVGGHEGGDRQHWHGVMYSSDLDQGFQEMHWMEAGAIEAARIGTVLGEWSTLEYELTKKGWERGDAGRLILQRPPPALYGLSRGGAMKEGRRRRRAFTTTFCRLRTGRRNL
jgi:hypothetical protein